MFVIAICVWVVYTPLVWIRRIEPLAKPLIFAAVMILFGVIVTSYFAIDVFV